MTPCLLQCKPGVTITSNPSILRHPASKSSNSATVFKAPCPTNPANQNTCQQEHAFFLRSKSAQEWKPLNRQGFQGFSGYLSPSKIKSITPH